MTGGTPASVAKEGGNGTVSERKENGPRAASAVGLEIVPEALSSFPFFSFPFLFVFALNFV
jgi:hypothetical protein